MKNWFHAVLAALTLAVATPTWAQNYPQKLVRIVVPNGAGGPTDLIARVMAQKLSESMGQSFIVENRLAQVWWWALNRWPAPQPTATPCCFPLRVPWSSHRT